MALNDVTFSTISGGLSRTLAGEDHISAMMFAIAAPAGWPSNKFKQFNDLDSVITAGITKGHATYGECYYHAKEFFRVNPGATLWIGLNATLPTYAEMQTATAGKVRQMGVYFTTFSDLTTVHQTGVTALMAAHAPLVVIAAYQGSSLTISTVADQAANSAPQVAVLLAGDHAGEGAALATTLSKTYIPALGAVLGAVSKAAVHECVAWPQQFNLSDGTELETIRLADGTSPTTTVIDGLNTKRYLCLRKHTGFPGTYLADSHTATASTGDFAYIEPNRVIQKARRGLRTYLIPYLNSPLTVDGTTGKLVQGSVKFFESLAGQALTQMLRTGEISDFAVSINPDQNVLSTSTLNIGVKIVPRGVARNIAVQIGLSVTTTF